MFKKIIIGVFILISGITLAQEGTSSPYSYYGVGTLTFRGTTESRSMGGLGVFSDSIHLNLQNPAAYADLRLINFSIGGNHKATKEETETESQNNSSTSIDYVAMGIPMGKLGMGFGLLPYTAVGYDFYSQLSDGRTQYTGSGGLNKAFLSIGYQVIQGLNVGIEGSYNFGKIENTAVTQKTDLQYATRVYNRSDLYGLSFKIGVIYKRMITPKLELTGSATYIPGTDFTSENYRKVATVFISNTGSQPIVDEREIDLANTDFSFPSQLTVGLGISQPKIWAIGGEYTYQTTSNLTNRSFEIDNVEYKDASRYTIGGHFIPNYNSFGSYFKRVTYRAGIRYEETGINVDGHDINEFGISFGAGFPVGRLFSNLNIGFEIGQRGTTDYGLVKETFINTFLSFSLNDRWFEKRLYD